MLRRNPSCPRDLLRPRRLFACAAIVAISLAGLPSGASAAKRDTQPPSMPPNLHVSSASSTAVTFAWGSSTDNVRVVGYLVNVGSSLTRVKLVAGLNYTVTGLGCGASVTVKVTAFDRAGNRSAAATATGSTTACAPGPPPPPPAGEPAPIAGQGYAQKWGDEFDTLGSTNWGAGIWYARGAPANSIFVQGGALNLVSRRSQGYQDITVTTEGGTNPKTFKYGYFESRMKWTAGQGGWPAFWLYSYRHATNPAWPSINPLCSLLGEPLSHCWAGEIDVFEGQGDDPSGFYHTIHENSCGCNYGPADRQNANNYTNVAPTNLTTGFHTYGLLWTATSIKWYLDGQLLHTETPYESLNQPMFVLYNIWIGGWSGGTNASTPAELKTEVDWVRVWQK
jgi:beta-glucanase (GH16 family)